MSPTLFQIKGVRIDTVWSWYFQGRPNEALKIWFNDMFVWAAKYAVNELLRRYLILEPFLVTCVTRACYSNENLQILPEMSDNLLENTASSVIKLNINPFQEADAETTRVFLERSSRLITNKS